MSKMDASYPVVPDQQNLSKKQVTLMKEASRGCWYVEQFIRMSLTENKLAGKKMKKHNRGNYGEDRA